MSKLEFALDDLRRILREGAGAAEGLDLNGDILDQEFSSLGYDSLALLETGGRIAREYRVELADTTVTSAQTPRELIEAVNTTLSATTTD